METEKLEMLNLCSIYVCLYSLSDNYLPWFASNSSMLLHSFRRVGDVWSLNDIAKVRATRCYLFKPQQILLDNIYTCEGLAIFSVPVDVDAFNAHAWLVMSQNCKTSTVCSEFGHCAFRKWIRSAMLGLDEAKEESLIHPARDCSHFIVPECCEASGKGP